MPDRIWNAAEYTRLSRDDGDKAESNSITSQKENHPGLCAQASGICDRQGVCG